MSESESQDNEQEWKFYDFDANWDKFLEIWKSEPVQKILDVSMNHWCDRHTNMKRYERGDQLWKFSNYDYWESEESYEAIEESFNEVEKYGMVNTYKKRMKEVLDYKYDSSELNDSYIFSTCADAIRTKFTPKDDSIESFIMYGGKKYIFKALFQVSIILFKNSQLIIPAEVYPENNKFVLIPEEKIVFDLYDYYHIVKCKNPDYFEKSDGYYDKFCNPYNENNDNDDEEDDNNDSDYEYDEEDDDFDYDNEDDDDDEYDEDDEDDEDDDDDDEDEDDDSD
jgi:hypothetical protein